MKKYLFPALALGLVMTSCQSDEPFAPVEGGEKQVTFTLNVPGELGTRAGATGNNSGVGGFSNGQGTLYYTLVLDANGDTRVFKDATVSNDGRTATFTPTVVLGRDYTITAYASFDDNTSINAKADIEAITVSKNFNDETKDAYFHTTRYNFANGDLQPLTLTLTRPFGKLRLVATDYKAGGTALNTEIQSVKVTYHDQQTATFNAVEGLFSYNGVNGDIEATKPFEGYYSSTADETTLFADYIPANSQDNMVDFTVEVKYAGSEETYYRRFNDIPVRRNSLTTLKGAFFTAGAQITVNVDDNFENEQLIEKRVTVTTADELTHAIATATDNSIIYFDNDITGNATAVQRQGIDVIIDGRGHKYDGTITVNGDGGSTNPETLTFQNINFYTNKDVDTDFTFISAPSKINDKYNYSHNVTIQNCTFESYYPYTTAEHGSASFTGTYNFVMKNCTAKNMHSLLQTQSCDNTVLVENVKTVSCKNGVSFGNTAFPTLRNSTIEAAEYGVRADGNASRGDLKIENTTVKAKKPVIVRKMTTNSYNVALNGADLQTAELYHVVFTKGDDEAAYEAPTGAFTISGADDYNVYPMQPGAEVKANSQAQLTNAINAGATNIVLAEGTYVMPNSAQGKTLTFIGTGNPEDVRIATNNTTGSYEGCNYAFDGSTVTFENISINTPSTTYIGYARCKATYKNCVINGTFTLYDDTSFEDCTFNVSGDVYNIWTWGAKNVTFNKCTFNSDGKALLYYQEGNNTVNVNVNNCIFNDKGGLADKKAAIEIGDAPYGATPIYNLNVNNTVVNGYEINDNGINTGTTLWANKNSMPAERLNVFVNGVDVY